MHVDRIWSKTFGDVMYPEAHPEVLAAEVVARELEAKFQDALAEYRAAIKKHAKAQIGDIIVDNRDGANDRYLVAELNTTNFVGYATYRVRKETKTGWHKTIQHIWGISGKVESGKLPVIKASPETLTEAKDIAEESVSFDVLERNGEYVVLMAQSGMETVMGPAFPTEAEAEAFMKRTAEMMVSTATSLGAEAKITER